MANERYDPGALAALGARLLQAAGTLAESAAAVGEHVVDSELRGISSHGLQRIPQYLDYIESGYVRPEGAINLARDGPLLRVDGGGGFGIPAMNRAVEELRATSGVGLAAVSNVTHTGRVGRYVEDLAEAGFLAWTLGGGYWLDGGTVAPYGGRRGFLSTNPHAFAFPGGRYGPLVADFASSAVAQGRVAVARDKGEALPPGALIDKEGRPSTHAPDFFDGGALLTAAGPKGYGLGLMAELVGYALMGKPREFNWLIVALPVALFRDPAEVTAAAEECLAACKAVPPADGFAEVTIPGELERRRKAEALREGLALAPYLVERLREAAAKLGVSAAPL